MVMITSEIGYFVDDPFWDRDIDFHVYEKREQASVKRDFMGIAQESTMIGSDYKIRIAKARVLDRARKKMILDTRRQARETFPDFFSAGVMAGSRMRRTVGGVEGVPDSAIMI